jgi:arylsulfatase A-like enzyme
MVGSARIRRRGRPRRAAGHAAHIKGAARQKELGIIPRDFVPNPLLPATTQRPTWEQLTPEQRAYEARRMEVYAAMVENLDYNIGRLLQHLKRVGEYDHTFIFFQSDNGSESGNQDRATANNALDNVDASSRAAPKATRRSGLTARSTFRASTSIARKSRRRSSRPLCWPPVT